MSQINHEKLCKTYLTNVKNKLEVILSREQTNQIMYTIKQNVSSYFDENPSATFEDFKQHFGEPEDIIACYLDESSIQKLDTSMHKKRCFTLIAVLISSLFIFFGILCVITYSKANNATVTYEKDIIHYESGTK